MKTNPLWEAARRLVPEITKGKAVVYFLRLNSGAIYIGCSIDLEQRLDDHWSGQACRTTQIDRPSAVLRIETCVTFSEARRREDQLKRWSQAKKEALIWGELGLLHTLSKSRD